MTNILYSTSATPSDFPIIQDVVIAITSVIKTSDAPMIGPTGLPVKRSVITPKDRFDQTIHQLNMTREKCPDATIILLEMSLDIDDRWLLELSSKCDYLVRCTGPFERDYCHTNYQNKGLGEMAVMVLLGNLIQDKPFKWFCKLNGRYSFLRGFNIQPFLADVPVANCIKGNGRLGIFANTIFYSVPKKYYKLYKEHFNAWLDPSTSEPVEHVFTMFLECVKRIGLINPLGIGGVSAVTGKYAEL